MLALDDRGLHAELRRADRRDIAAGPAADHDDVEEVSAKAFSYSTGFTAETHAKATALRRFDQFLERGHELRAERAIDHAMIEGQRCSS